jgi:hypothetical protein
MLDNGNTIVMLKAWSGNPWDVGTLCHEAFHAVWALMEHVGVTPSDDSEEAMAYALDDIVTTMMKALTPSQPSSSVSS